MKAETETYGVTTLTVYSLEVIYMKPNPGMELCGRVVLADMMSHSILTHMYTTKDDL